MPRVASETKTHAAKLPQPRAARPAQAFDRAPAPTFESLLDDNAPAAADRAAQPAVKATTQPAVAAQPAQKHAGAGPTADNAKRSDTEPVDAPPANTATPAVAPDGTEIGEDAKVALASMSDAATATETGPDDDTKTDADPDSARALALPEAAAIQAVAVAPALAGPATVDMVKTETAGVAEIAPQPAAETAAPTSSPDALPAPAASKGPSEAAAAANPPETEPAAKALINPADHPELFAKDPKPERTAKAVTAGAPVATDAAAPPRPNDAEVSASMQPQADDKPAQAATGDVDGQSGAHVRGKTPVHVRQTENVAVPAAAPADPAALAVKATDGAALQSAFGVVSHVETSSPAPQAMPSAAQPAPQAAVIPLSGVAIEIAGKALAGKNRFEIRLDPPELGRIEVRLDVDHHGRVTSHLIVERADTLDLLRRDAPGLERALQDAGLKTTDNGLQFSLRDGSNGHGQRHDNSPVAHLLVDEQTPSTDVIPQAYGRLAGRGSGLDIRV